MAKLLMLYLFLLVSTLASVDTIKQRQNATKLIIKAKKEKRYWTTTFEILIGEGIDMGKELIWVM